MSTNLRRQRRLAEAVAADRDALAVAERSLRPEHHATGYAMIHLGDHVNDIGTGRRSRGMAVPPRPRLDDAPLGRKTAFGSRHSFLDRGLMPLGPSRFPGMEPAGDYPIHIVVKQGRITLLGVVDSEADKTMAGMKARQVPGSFGVENELTIDRPGGSGPSGRR